MAIKRIVVSDGKIGFKASGDWSLEFKTAELLFSDDKHMIYNGRVAENTSDSDASEESEWPEPQHKRRVSSVTVDEPPLTSEDTESIAAASETEAGDVVFEAGELDQSQAQGLAGAQEHADGSKLLFDGSQNNKLLVSMIECGHVAIGDVVSVRIDEDKRYCKIVRDDGDVGVITSDPDGNEDRRHRAYRSVSSWSAKTYDKQMKLQSFYHEKTGHCMRNMANECDKCKTKLRRAPKRGRPTISNVLASVKSPRIDRESAANDEIAPEVQTLRNASAALDASASDEAEKADDAAPMKTAALLNWVAEIQEKTAKSPIDLDQW